MDKTPQSPQRKATRFREARAGWALSEIEPSAVMECLPGTEERPGRYGLAPPHLTARLTARLAARLIALSDRPSDRPSDCL